MASRERLRKGPYGCIYGPWIKDLPRMGHNELRILLMLLERLDFDEHGNATAWQPRAVMAESLGLSERQVSDAVRRLREKGVLSVKRPGCNGHATVYNVMPGKPWPADEELVADLIDLVKDRERGEKLHELADGLRELVADAGPEGVNDVAVLDILGICPAAIWGYSDPRDVECLADLIDRPTCRNLAEEPEDFRCSACGGMKFDIFAARYCPDCGAEIIVS